MRTSVPLKFLNYSIALATFSLVAAQTESTMSSSSILNPGLCPPKQLTLCLYMGSMTSGKISLTLNAAPFVEGAFKYYILYLFYFFTIS